MAVIRNEVDLLAQLTPPVGDLEFSAFSPNDAQANPGPSPGVATRVLAMHHTPVTERNQIKPIAIQRATTSRSSSPQ